MTPKTITLLCAGLLTLSPAAHALSPAVEKAAQSLARGAPERPVLQKIRDQADPAFKPLVSALQSGALYPWKGTLLFLNDSGAFTDLDGKPLLDAAGQPLAPSGLTAFSVDPGDQGLLEEALHFMALSDENPGTREAAARKLGSLGDPAARPYLQKALFVEQRPDVKAAILEALAKLDLQNPDPAARRGALGYFKAHPSDAAMSPLQTFLQKEQDPSLRRMAESVTARIERRLRVRNWIGYAFDGLSLSSVLLIMSIGLAITFGLMGIINMAHGEMLMLGSYAAYVLQQFFAAHFPARQDYFFFAALPLSLLAIGLIGFVLERGLLRFLYGRPLESLLVTWGIGMVLSQGARLYFGDQTSVNAPTWFRGGWEAMPGLIFPYSRLFIIFLSLACLIAVYWLLYRTVIGLKVRAVMENREMASCMGISTQRVDALTFAFGTALAGLGGCALSLIGTVDPEVGKTYIVDSFMVVVTGGVGKLLGVVLASFGIGMSNKVLEPAIGGTASAVYSKVIVLVLVILFLQIRPQGIFAPKGRDTSLK